MMDEDSWSPIGLSDDESLPQDPKRTIIIVLETSFNDVGHADDEIDNVPDMLLIPKAKEMLSILSKGEEEQNIDANRQLPMVVFKAARTFIVENERASCVATPAEILRGKKIIRFPSKRLLDGYAQVLSKCLDPNTVVDVTKPDLLSVLTAGIMLKNEYVIEACVEAIHNDRLGLSDFHRALTLVQRYPEFASFVDAAFLFALRHSKELVLLHPLVEQWESLSIFDQSAVRIKSKFVHLFNPVVVKTISSTTDSGVSDEKVRTKGFPHLEKHRFERICVDGSQDRKHFVLRRESDNGFICGAMLNQAKTAFLLFSSEKYPCDMRSEDVATYCGKVKANFLGNMWVLYDAAGKLRRTSSGQINYAQNALGRVPNAMTVHLPEGVRLETKKPRWTDQKGYSLDFRGRVIKASKKNFILLNNDLGDDQNENIVMLFGKYSKNVFSLDLAPPMSPLLGFAVALTTFADKLIVT